MRSEWIKIWKLDYWKETDIIHLETNSYNDQKRTISFPFRKTLCYFVWVGQLISFSILLAEQHISSRHNNKWIQYILNVHLPLQWHSVGSSRRSVSFFETILQCRILAYRKFVQSKLVLSNFDLIFHEKLFFNFMRQF